MFMKSKTMTSMGAMHPFLFFAIVYIVALLMAVFICSSLFYSCQAKETKNLSEYVGQKHKG